MVHQGPHDSADGPPDPSWLSATPWFVKRRQGRGVVPFTWQGWAAIVILVILATSFAGAIKHNHEGGIIGLVLAFVCFGVVVVCTSERTGTS